MHSLTIVATNKNRLAVDSLMSQFFFKSLHLQEYADFEMVIVDGGSDNYDEIKTHFETNSKIAVRFIQHKIEGKFKRALLLNIGIRAANTPFVMCTDVDMLFHPKFLATLMKNVKEHTLVVSRTTFLTAKATKRIYRGKHDFFNTEDNSTHGRFKRRTTCGGCQCMHIDDWFEIRGYNEQYEGWGSEDNDVVKRVDIAKMGTIWLGDTPETVLLFHQFHPRNKAVLFEARNANRDKYWDVKSTKVNPNGWGNVSDNVSDLSGEILNIKHQEVIMDNTPKRGFVRVLWGVHQIDTWHKHRIYIDDQMQYLKLNPLNPPFTALVFGEDNYKQLVDLGFDCRLVDRRPTVWDMNTQQFRHKLEALKCGMELFDEMVFLDWDTQPYRALPDNFWERFYEKEDIQVSLRLYHRRRVTWRKLDARKVPCAAFIYLRNKETPNELIRIWESLGKPWTEEMVLMKHIDEKMGGWKGLDEYWKKFELPYFNLEDGGAVYPEELIQTKYLCFEHVIRRRIVKKLHELGIITAESQRVTKKEAREALNLRKRKRAEKKKRDEARAALKAQRIELLP